MKKEEDDIRAWHRKQQELDQAKMVFSREGHPIELERALRNAKLEPKVVQTADWKAKFGTPTSSGVTTPARTTSTGGRTAYHTPGKKTAYFTPGK